MFLRAVSLGSDRLGRSYSGRFVEPTEDRLMLPPTEMWKWLKGQGAERILEMPDGSMIAYRKSVSMTNKKHVYWAMLSIAKIEQGYVRAGDAWLLCDNPHADAKEWTYES